MWNFSQEKILQPFSLASNGIKHKGILCEATLSKRAKSPIMGMGLGESVALITDGRFSGATRGGCIGHISPEAAEGGLIALIEDGDKIAISVSKGTLELLVDSKIIESRRAQWKPIKKEIKSKWLKRYSLLVSNAANGAVLKTEL